MTREAFITRVGNHTATIVTDPTTRIAPVSVTYDGLNVYSYADLRTAYIAVMRTLRLLDRLDRLDRQRTLPDWFPRI